MIPPQQEVIKEEEEIRCYNCRRVLNEHPYTTEADVYDIKRFVCTPGCGVGFEHIQD